jgi:hypothetical protein
MDKTNLKRKVAELDEMVKALLGPPPSMQQQTQLTLKNKVRLHVTIVSTIMEFQLIS